MTCGESDRAASCDGDAIDVGDRESRAAWADIVVQNVNDFDLVGIGEMIRVIVCDQHSLNAVGGDQKIRVIAAVEHVGDADTDRVGDPWIDIHCERHGDGEAVHFGIVIVVSVVDVEVFVVALVDVSGVQIAIPDANINKATVDPDADKILIE